MSSPIKHYRVKQGAGSHFEGDKEYKAGDLVPSLHDLATKFENKFEPGIELPTAAPAASAAPATKTVNTGGTVKTEGGEKKDETKKDDAPPADEGSPLGEDVTADFPKVKGGGFTVFKKGKDFSVSEDDGKTAINPKPLKKIEVEDFVTDFAKKA